MGVVGIDGGHPNSPQGGTPPSAAKRAALNRADRKIAGRVHGPDALQHLSCTLMRTSSVRWLLRLDTYPQPGKASCRHPPPCPHPPSIPLPAWRGCPGEWPSWSQENWSRRRTSLGQRRRDAAVQGKGAIDDWGILRDRKAFKGLLIPLPLGCLSVGR